MKNSEATWENEKVRGEAPILLPDFPPGGGTAKRALTDVQPLLVDKKRPNLIRTQRNGKKE